MSEGDYLEFRLAVQGPKTNVWHVMSRSRGIRLGIIKWYGPWRQYCFFPEPETLYNATCLREIQNVITEQMMARRRR